MRRKPQNSPGLPETIRGAHGLAVRAPLLFGLSYGPG